MELSSELVRAKSLLEQGQVESCLEVLSAIGADYKRASYFVDLLGDAFLSKGDVQRAARYKTLFEILTKVLESLDQESVGLIHEHYGEQLYPTSHFVRFQRDQFSSLMDEEEESDDEESKKLTPDVMPVTLAIGKQYLAQGHFDLAAAVFEKLVLQNPMDLELQNLLAKARNSKRRETITRVLQTWLEKVEKLKTQRKTFT